MEHLCEYGATNRKERIKQLRRHCFVVEKELKIERKRCDEEVAAAKKSLDMATVDVVKSEGVQVKLLLDLIQEMGGRKARVEAELKLILQAS